MINLSTKQALQNLGNPLSTPQNRVQRIASQSFASQLTALFAKPGTASGPASTGAAASTAGRQLNTPRQLSVATPQASTPSTPALTASLSKTTAGFSALAEPGPTVATSPATTTPSSPAATPAATPKDTTTTPGSLTDDTYWASQPAAVQQLREIDDEGQRAAMASQLASEGYKVDVPVMVWGWDPVKTMQLRETAGYTWVPSALQKPVEAAPGLTAPGMTPYDPNNPPPGSISVAV